MTTTDRPHITHASALLTFVALVSTVACEAPADGPDDAPEDPMVSSFQDRVEQYATVRLTADISHLSAADQDVLRHLIQAVEPMDSVFWHQAHGDRRGILARAGDDEWLRRYIDINYGPWDRLANDQPFVEGVGPKPAGANFYPDDMTDEEFESASADQPALRSLYTLVRRAGDSTLTAVPYHIAYSGAHQTAANHLAAAASVAEEPGLQRYLELRAEALRTDDYRASDMAWLDMKDNAVDVVIGPIETYEDQRFGLKAAHEGFVLIKDQEWSARLQRFAAMLPELQRGLPVEDAYKQESPGSDSDLNAYDVVYYAGDANAGSKTIAINLPNDEEVQLAKGTRRLQLKNAMRAKFDEIMVPIAATLIAEDQRQHVTFDAFFANTMFHEVAHGLGIKNTLSGAGTVREALREHASSMEEGKADVLGLYMVTELLEQGEIDEGTLEDYYVTFLAGIFRSVRFGASSAHGVANMVRFNYFQEHGAFSRDEATGTYRVDMARMREAVDGLSALILRLQGDGDYDAAALLVEERGVVGEGNLQADLARLATAGIPVDVVFEQGPAVLFGG